MNSKINSLSECQATDDVNSITAKTSVPSSHPFLPPAFSQAISAKSQSDHSVASSILLAAIAAAAQDGFQVRMHTGTVKPVGLMVCVASPSGSRKSTALELVAKPIFDREKSYADLNDKEAKRYRAKLKAHKAIENHFRTKIQKAKVDQIAPLAQELEELEINKPRAPKTHKRILSNTTIEGLYKHYAEAGYGAFVLADEGRQAMDLLMNNNAAILSKLADGDDLSINRATARSVDIRSPKFTGLFLLQPGVLREQNKKRGEVNLASGLIARMLFTQVDTLEHCWPCFPTQDDDAIIAALHQRLKELLDCSEQVASGAKAPIVLQLDADATELFHCTMANYDFERRNTPDISDSASSYLARAGENILRIAALVHLLVGNDWDSAITRASVQHAVSVAQSYKAEYMRLFEFGGLDQNQHDEIALLGQLQRHYWSASFTKTHVHHVSPRAFRGDGKRLSRCLERLVNKGAVFTQKVPDPAGRRWLTWYEVNRSLLLVA